MAWPIILIYVSGSREAVSSHIGVTPANFAAVAVAAVWVLKSAEPGWRRGLVQPQMFWGGES